MWYRLLADGSPDHVHLAFIVFLMALGGLVVLRWPRLAWLHTARDRVGVRGSRIQPDGSLPSPCRSRSGLARAQRRGDVHRRLHRALHNITRLIYPEGLDRRYYTGIVLGAFVLVLNAGIYAWLPWRRRRLQPRWILSRATSGPITRSRVM